MDVARGADEDAHEGQYEIGDDAPHEVSEVGAGERPLLGARPVDDGDGGPHAHLQTEEEQDDGAL